MGDSVWWINITHQTGGLGDSPILLYLLPLVLWVGAGRAKRGAQIGMIIRYDVLHIPTLFLRSYKYAPKAITPHLNLHPNMTQCTNADDTHTTPMDVLSGQQPQPYLARGRRGALRPPLEKHVKWHPGLGLEINDVQTIVRETAPATNETQRRFTVANRLPVGSSALSQPSQEESTALSTAQPEVPN